MKKSQASVKTITATSVFEDAKITNNEFGKEKRDLIHTKKRVVFQSRKKKCRRETREKKGQSPGEVDAS